MPNLDMSDVILDPDLADRFTVNRYVQTLDHGRLVKGVPTPFAGVIGTVCMASPNDLKRFPEGQVTNKCISIVTLFRLHASAVADDGTQLLPDEILWHGSAYTVIWVDDYAGFGRGMIEAIAESTLRQDPPPPGSPP